jgi:hypothetical protein
MTVQVLKGQHGELNDMMPPVLEEREPGVYVRGNRAEQELDFLWDRDRKRGAEHDRFHIGFFAGGFVVGAVITLAGCLLFFSNGKFFPTPSVLEKPAVVEEQVLTPKDFNRSAEGVNATATATTAANKPEAAAKPEENKGLGLPFFSKPKEKAPVAPEAQARFYAVQSGDNLGTIAIKFYDSSNPELIQKIQRANKMTDADTLKLGQKLVIPPKSY